MTKVNKLTENKYEKNIFVFVKITTDEQDGLVETILFQNPSYVNMLMFC